MKCGKVTSMLADHLDGLLAPREGAAIQEHLLRCPKCREELRFLKAYRDEIAAFPRLKAPRDLLERVHRGIAAPPPSRLIDRIFSPPAVTIPLGAVAVLAVGVIALFLFRPPAPERHEVADTAPVIRESSPEAGRRADDGGGAITARRDAKERQRGAERETTRGVIVASNGFKDEARPTEKKSDSSERVGVTLYLSMNRQAPAPLSKTPGMTMKREAARVRSERPGEEAETDSVHAMDERAGIEGPSARDRADLDSIAAIVKAVNGRVTGSFYDEKQKRYSRIMVEVPAEQSDRFIRELNNRWNVTKQESKPQAEKSEAVRFNMFLTD